MNKKLKEAEYKIKSEIMAEFFPKEFPEYKQYEGKKKFYVFLCGFYQNMGDMALTYAHEQFLKDNFPGYEIVMVPGYKTYPGMKQLKKMFMPGDIVTILGGGNIDDLYVSLENARRFIIRKFPDSPVISFPQTMGFTDTPYGAYRKKKTVKTYNKNKNLKIFTREPNSLKKMQECFTSEIGYCPDMVLYLKKDEPVQERRGWVCCLRSDLEMKLSREESESIVRALKSRTDDLLITDTVNVTEEECRPENYKNTLESFWKMLRSRQLVVTDRLHCMIFCAITQTPCVVFDNSNKKISGVYDTWLKDCNYIRLCPEYDCDMMLSFADELCRLKPEDFTRHDLTEKFAPLAEYISSVR